MSERDSASPPHDTDARLGDLFENLPAPAPQVPTADTSGPVPGSRRAAREAARRAARQQQAGEPSLDQSGTAPAPAASGSADSASDARPAPVAPRAEDRASAAAEPVSAAEPSRAPETTAVPIARGSRETFIEHDADATRPLPRVSAPAAASTARTSPVEPAVGGGLDDLFVSGDDDHRGPGAPKKKRRKGCLIALIVVLAIIGGIVAGGAWAWSTYGERISDAMGWGDAKDWEPGLATGEVYVTIKSGDTGQPVSAALHEAGVTKTADVFYDYLIDEGIAVTFYPGVYRLQKKMTAEAALAALQDKENKLENTVSVSEGGTIKSSLPAMAETLGLPLADFEAAVADPSVYGVQAQSLEGWLFPAVYTFDPGVTATQAIQQMVDRTREALDAAGVPADDAQRVLTIASIIQREGRTDDFAKVSRVIENRLAIDMKLQMDSTAQYGYGSLHEGVVSSSAEALEDPNPWNTYVNTGLPVTPIASPSEAAIKAAMQPADGPWLYFVTVNLSTGETQFSETLAEHEQGVEKWREWCRANPDGGC
ncbi:endolytic transglycosylase MltG [Microbacterium sp. NPDC055599]